MARGNSKRDGKKTPASAGHTDARHHYGYRRVVQYVPFDTLDAVFDDDALLHSIISFLLQDGATSKSDSTVLAPLLQVSKAWNKALTVISNQMRFDHLSKLLSRYAKGEAKDEPRLMELYYLPPQANRCDTTTHRTDTFSATLHLFLDRHVRVGYPDGVLFIRRTPTNGEVRDLIKSPAGKCCCPTDSSVRGRHMTDGGKWTAFIPHFRCSEPFHVVSDLLSEPFLLDNNIVYEYPARLLRYKDDSLELEEFIGDGKY